MTAIQAPRRIRRWIAASSVAIVGLGVLAVLAYRHEYGRVPWSDHPDQVSACGRDFQDAQSVVDRSEAIRQSGGPIRPAGHTPGWPESRTVWIGTAGYQATSGTDGCQAALAWLRVGPDQFRSYVLEGSD
ncbi:hypothetical protein [Jatrophihabitans sp.]|uniref:hypothetical protein n=1 Tax=Jatrophihabitans sp. TaxID=1932789 RepID=UPI0030C6AD32